MARFAQNLISLTEQKPSILFLSASSAVFDTIPEECFTMYNFHLLKITPKNSINERISNRDLVIIDTYSLGVDFLDKVSEMTAGLKIPILIIDDFNDQIIIGKMFDKGAKGYLNIDEYGDLLKSKIQKLIPKLGMMIL